MSPEPQDRPVWETRAPAGTSSICESSTWNQLRHYSGDTKTRSQSHDHYHYCWTLLSLNVFIFIIIIILIILLLLNIVTIIRSNSWSFKAVRGVRPHLKPGQTLGVSQSLSSSIASGQSCPPLDGSWMTRRYLDCFVFTTLPAEQTQNHHYITSRHYVVNWWEAGNDSEFRYY